MHWGYFTPGKRLGGESWEAFLEEVGLKQALKSKSRQAALRGEGTPGRETLRSKGPGVTQEA